MATDSSSTPQTSNSIKVDVPVQYWDNIFAPPSCAVMITTTDSKGNVNAGSFATCTRVAHNPVCMAFTTSTTGDTIANVLETGEFVVNVLHLDRALLEKALIVGLPFKKGINELKKAGLTEIPSQIVKPPRIAECKSHLECKIEWTKQWIDRWMVVGRVVAVSIDEGCMNKNGFIVWEKMKPVHWCGSVYKNKFVPAFEPVTIDFKYQGSDEEMRPGSNWRTMFVPRE